MSNYFSVLQKTGKKAILKTKVFSQTIEGGSEMEKAVWIIGFGILALVVLVVINKLLNREGLQKKINTHCKRSSITLWGRTYSYSLFHPNNICYTRTLLAWLALVVYHFGFPIVGVILFMYASMMDALDGIIARKCDLFTKWGETLDPICDKLTYLVPIIYFAYIGLMPLYSVYIFLFLESIGQLIARLILRNMKLSVASNNFGKIKAVLCFVLVPYCFLMDNFFEIPNFAPQLMWLCIILSLNSLVFKLIPNRYYANILSLMNLVCGLVGCFFVIQDDFIFAAILVMMGQIFDLFDGRMAQKFGGTKWGPWIDDIADFVSFGICPALAILFIDSITAIFVVCAIVYALAVAYRLWRFVMREKSNGLPEGVFWGLPSPAGALAVLGTIFVWKHSMIAAGVILIIVLLLISKIEFAHFRTIIAKRTSRPFKVVTGSIICGCIAFFTAHQSLFVLGVFMLSAAIVYALTSRVMLIK